LLWKIAIEIVDLPTKNGDSPPSLYAYQRVMVNNPVPLISNTSQRPGPIRRCSVLGGWEYSYLFDIPIELEIGVDAIPLHCPTIVQYLEAKIRVTQTLCALL
jgi:hypothetical protein